MVIFIAHITARTVASAQTQVVEPVISPQVLADHRVVFRLRAPNAKTVSVAGDFWQQQNRVEELSKDADGVWSLTAGPLASDYYSYYFTVDGLRIPDPANGLIKPGVSETQSAFFVPDSQTSLLTAATIPHGEIRIITYQSKTLQKPRRMHIYVPPGYERGRIRYPVVYLLHGGGDDDGAWESIGRVNFILDNLIAQRRAKPMIVVMPTLWALDPPVKADFAAENATLFERSLREDVLPYVKAHYRILLGPANRAVGGLGAGRDFLPNFVWSNFGRFDTIFFVSGGADTDRFAFLQAKYPGVIDNPRNVRRISFFIGAGVNDASFASGRNLAGELNRRGYRVAFVQSENTHGWPEFRYNFEQFAQLAFRGADAREGRVRSPKPDR